MIRCRNAVTRPLVIDDGYTSGSIESGEEGEDDGRDCRSIRTCSR